MEKMLEKYKTSIYILMSSGQVKVVYNSMYNKWNKRGHSGLNMWPHLVKTHGMIEVKRM